MKQNQIIFHELSRFRLFNIQYFDITGKIVRSVPSQQAALTSWRPSPIGRSTWGSRWSSTPGRSPSSRTSRSSPPLSHNPTWSDTRPPCRPPPPCRSSSRQPVRNKLLRPFRTPGSRPEPNTWTASHRTGRPGGSERNSLQREGQTGQGTVNATF